MIYSVVAKAAQFDFSLVLPTDKMRIVCSLAVHCASVRSSDIFFTFIAFPSNDSPLDPFGAWCWGAALARSAVICRALGRACIIDGCRTSPSRSPHLCTICVLDAGAVAANSAPQDVRRVPALGRRAERAAGRPSRGDRSAVRTRHRRSAEREIAGAARHANQ